MVPTCVVCACPADLYCHNDRAFLCTACDAHVHNAHVLASSHHRTPVSAAPVPEEAASEVMEAVVPQDFLPFPGKLEKDRLTGNLSFSDDAWFAVPDTACSHAESRVGGKSGKAKDFGFEDLFELDAALDDDIGLNLDRVSSDLLADCLVPDADVSQPAEVSLLPHEDDKAPTLSATLPSSTRAPQGATGAAAPPLSSFPHPSGAAPAAAPAPPSYSYCARPSVAADSLLTFSQYIPASLLPVDPTMRTTLLAERRDKVQRFREKKKNRQFKKLIRYASRKRYAEVRPRIKGRFARKDEIAAAKAAGIPLTC